MAEPDEAFVSGEALCRLMTELFADPTTGLTNTAHVYARKYGLRIEDADDLQQAAMAKVYAYSKGNRIREATLAGLLATTLRTCAIDCWRRQLRRAMSIDERGLDIVPEVSCPVEDRPFREVDQAIVEEQRARAVARCAARVTEIVAGLTARRPGLTRTRWEALRTCARADGTAAPIEGKTRRSASAARGVLRKPLERLLRAVPEADPDLSGTTVDDLLTAWGLLELTWDDLRAMQSHQREPTNGNATGSGT